MNTAADLHESCNRTHITLTDEEFNNLKASSENRKLCQSTGIGCKPCYSSVLVRNKSNNEIAWINDVGDKHLFNVDQKKHPSCNR